jgi:hypothetical protein
VNRSDHLARRHADLAYLTWHWGAAYEITYRLGQYRAVRRDDGAMIRADSAGDLLDAIRQDYAARPVPRES